MTVTDDQLLMAARAYGSAVSAQPHRVSHLVGEALGVSRATAIRHVARAKKAGLIREYGEHFPRTVRWSDNSGSWVACSECRSPWPCPIVVAEHPEQFGDGDDAASTEGQSRDLATGSGSVRRPAADAEQQPSLGDGDRGPASEVIQVHRGSLPGRKRQRRRAISNELLIQVAAVYRGAIATTGAPTKAVAKRFRVSHSSAARYVRIARARGHLGHAIGTKPGEVDG